MTVFADGLLTGRRVLITGGGTGIGLGIAEAMAQLGAGVAIASRKPEHLEPALERLAAHGGRALAIEANVRDRDSIGAGVQHAADALGGLDILVNNAAGNFYAPSAEVSPNGWRAIVETDLYGTFFASQAAYPFLKASAAGRIISISMTLHYRGWPMMAPATAAKAGVDALTRTLALEWARDGITVNAIAPGPVPTHGATRAFASGGEPGGSLDDDMRRMIPLGRWGTPDDIAETAVFLASPAGAWITGAIFVVDGGSWLART